MTASQRRLPTYIWRNRHGTYYFRAVIPHRLRAADYNPKAPREFRRSLRTDSWREAIVRARAWRAGFDSMLKRIDVTTNQTPDGDEKFQVGLIEMMTTTVDGRPLHIKTDWGHPNDMDAFKQILEKINNQSAATRVAQNAEPFETAFERYIADHSERKDWDDRTAAEYQHSAALFRELLGNVPVSTITSESMVKFRGQLFKLPSNMKKRPQYRDKTPTELLNLDIPETDRLSRRTVQKHIERLSSFFKWCVRNKLLSSNPAEGQAPIVAGRGYEPFDAQELVRLFSVSKWKPRSSYAHWLPLLGLFTGGRIAELCQLTTDDIVEDGGVFVMRILDDSSDVKSIKTAAARRIVPIHSQLIELGFLSYVEARRAAGEKSLFPDVANSNKASDWFARHRKRCGVGKQGDRRKVFHSFRKNVATALAHANVQNERIRELMGHEHEDVTFNVYVASSPAAVLKRDIELIRYDIALGHLRDHWRQFVRTGT